MRKDLMNIGSSDMLQTQCLDIAWQYLRVRVGSSSDLACIA